MANLLDFLKKKGPEEGDPGMPGAEQGGDLAQMSAEAMAQNMMKTGRKAEAIIGPKQIREAAETLRKYKEGKANYDQTIIENERWYKLRHWEYIDKKGNKAQRSTSTSGYLFNTLLNKHADAMDSFPCPAVLPREKNDVQSAKTLSDILPVILDKNDFRDTYSDNWWEKVKHGTAVYGVFWNNDKENGLGDIDIVAIDLLKIFWEPGKTKIQDSKNLFIVELADPDDLAAAYPEADKKKFGKSITVSEYIHDESIDTSSKVLVVDWYYKKRIGGRTVLHYVKFCGDALLYATENEPALRERGLYDHGLYPVVFDRMFPEKDSPVAFGFVAICKEAQMYIDKLESNILETAVSNSKRRFFASKGVNVDLKQLLDVNQPIVEVEGSIGNLSDKLYEMKPRDLPPIYPNIANMKVEEMKLVTGNRDVNSGGTGGGVTAASALALLQETGNKTSRDAIDAAYRAYEKINMLCIELIRQFYDEPRSFRIVGAPMQAPGQMPAAMPQGIPGAMGGGIPQGAGAPEGGMMTPRDGFHFVEFSNKMIKDQEIGVAADGTPMLRHPMFDLDIKAQKRNPFSREAQNQLALELFARGAFNPQMADAALCALSLMDFEGIEEVRERVEQGQTLLAQNQQLQQQLMQLQQVMAQMQAAAQGRAPVPGGAPR